MKIQKIDLSLNQFLRVKKSLKEKVKINLSLN